MAKVSTSEFSVVLLPSRFRNSAPPRFIAAKVSAPEFSVAFPNVGLRLVRQSFLSYLCQVGSEILLLPGLLLVKVSAPEISVALLSRGRPV